MAAQPGTIHSDYLAESGANLLVYEVADKVVAAVLNGEADSALVDESSGMIISPRATLSWLSSGRRCRWARAPVSVYERTMAS